MAQDPKVVQEKLKELREDRLTFVREELWQLPNQLEEEETLCAVASVQGDNGKTRLLAVTSKRMFFLYQEEKLEVVSYPLKEIRGCQIKKGILLSTLIFFLRSNELPLKCGGMDSMHAIMVFNAIKMLLNTDSKSFTEDTITRLERLASLLDKGILTKEEFMAQKQSILTEIPHEKKPVSQSIASPLLPTVEPSPQSTSLTIQGQKKKKTFVWVSVLLVFIIVGSYAFFNRFHNEPTRVEEPKTPLHAQPEVNQQTSSLVGHPLAVKIVNYKKYERNRRYWAEITIIPTEDQSKATQADFAATVIAVATQAHKETDAPIVSVTMLCQKAPNASGELQLAYVIYIADGHGLTGKTPGKKWEFLSAVPRGFTKQELKYLQLWAEMGKNYMDENGLLQVDKLEAAIAKKMKIKPDTINPHQIYPQPIESKPNIEGKLKITRNDEE